MATTHAARHSGQKLFGRAFYESIGSPKYILAPMVDQSEAAWRMLTRSFTPNSSKNLLAYSPMLHSRLFSNNPKYKWQNFSPFSLDHAEANNYQFDLKHPLPEFYLDGHPVLDRPLVVQFCSNSPDDLLAAARIVEPFCDAVDLNLGCPQGIARRGYYGAFLQEDWNLIYALINRLHQELSIPVTAKMRILDTKEETLEYAKMILSAGASIITVHGRRREQKGHYTGLADWSVLRFLRENLPPDTVIFANGNVLQHGDLKRCLEATGADGVMSAEGALADPTIFAEPPPLGQEGREYWRGKDGRGGYRMDAVLRRYMDIVYRHVLQRDPPPRRPLFAPSDVAAGHSVDADPSPDPTLYVKDSPNLWQREGAKQRDLISINLRVMQSHMFHLMRPLVAKHTDIRNSLAKCRVGDMAGFENVLQQVESAVREGLMEYENSLAFSDVGKSVSAGQQVDINEEEEALSSHAALKRCKLPWFVCQPYVRPLPSEAIEKGAITLSRKQKESHLAKAGPLVDAGINHLTSQTTTAPHDGLVSG